MYTFLCKMWLGDPTNTYTPLHDHSTIAGKLKILYHRLQLKLVLFLIGVGFILAILFAGSGIPSREIDVKTNNDDGANPVQTELLKNINSLGTTLKPILFLSSNLGQSRIKFNGKNSETSIMVPTPLSLTPPTVSPIYTDMASFWNGTFRYEGGSLATVKAPTFGSMVTNKAEVLKVVLLNVTIDASALSKDLEGCSNLKSIVLSNVFILGEFERVVLPSIEIFIFEQLANVGETKEDYQDEEKLKSRIFFDKTPTQNWNLRKDIGNLGTKIEFRLDGVTLLKISQESEEIVLYVPYCDDILQSLSWTISTLTLVKCNVSSSSIPVNLIYFNVYKVWILNGGNFTQIIKTFNRLTDFSAQIPGEIINLSDFPTTLTTLTVIDTDLDYRNDYRSTILNLAVGYHLGAKVLECLDKIMPGVQRVAVFGIPDELEANILLQKLLVNTTAKWIVMEEFKRNPNSNFPVQQWVEQYLSSLGIPENSNNFLIKMNRNSFNGFSQSGRKSGRELMPDEVEYYHYVLLGWYKTTTFQAYSKIQKRKLDNLKISG